MKLTSHTVTYLSEQGWQAICNILIIGLTKQLQNDSGDDLEFTECAEVWRDALILCKTKENLGEIFDSLNDDADDMFGTEGWEHGLGIPT